MRPYGVGKIGDIFAGCDIDESFPTKSNVEGINRTLELLENVDDGLVFTNLVETDQLWGHRNDPVNFHRCLQDFDRRLPDILEALRADDLLSSPPITAATRRRRRPITRASTRCCSRTPPAGMRPAASTRAASSAMSARRWRRGSGPSTREGRARRAHHRAMKLRDPVVAADGSVGARTTGFVATKAG